MIWTFTIINLFLYTIYWAQEIGRLYNNCGRLSRRLHISLDVCTFFFFRPNHPETMFHTVKGCMKLRTGGDHKAVYFPCRYLRRLIVAWMCHNRCVVWNHKKVSLMSKYGVEDGDVVPNPISFKDYLRKLLKRGFGGEDVVLYALSCIYDIRITVLNVCTLDEYRYRHSRPIAEADMVLIFTGSNHYLYAGK